MIDSYLNKKLYIIFSQMTTDTIPFPTRYDAFIDKLADADKQQLVTRFNGKAEGYIDTDPWFEYHLRMFTLRFLWLDARNASIAQLVEQVTLNHEDESSTLSGRTNFAA